MCVCVCVCVCVCEREREGERERGREGDRVLLLLSYGAFFFCVEECHSAVKICPSSKMQMKKGKNIRHTKKTLLHCMCLCEKRIILMGCLSLLCV